MGVDTRRPPLPAPTEPSVVSSVDNGSALADDLTTEVSRMTDRTSYSIPEDGSPVTITTKKLLGDKEGALSRSGHQSQTSLLIEYFEGGKSGEKVRSRPSVRVRVTPSAAKKSRNTQDHIQITETGKNRKPSYTRRISLGKPGDEKPPLPEETEVSYSEESNLTGRPPVEVEVLHNTSDLSRSSVSQGRYIPAPSDISSMPPDSMLEGEPVMQSPPRRRSRSLEREEVVTTDTLKTPSRRRSRSLSKERITQKVMAKLANDAKESSSRRKYADSRERSNGKEHVRDSIASSKRRSSRGYRDDESSRVESSLFPSEISRRSGDTHSIRSGTSVASSINNPKLLQTVEDAIRRLILPELNALKEEQKTQHNRDKYERITRDSIASTSSREEPRRRVSKSSSAPNVSGKPKVVLNRDGDDPGIVLSHGDSVKSRKVRRSSRDSTSERSYDRRESIGSASREEEKVSRKRSKDSQKVRDAAGAAIAGGVLTAAALREHESRSSLDRKERRKRRSKSRSRTASICETVEDTYQEKVPPLPMQSEIQSDLTRESILSAETERPHSRSSKGVETPVQEVSRGSPRQIISGSPRTPTRTPVSLRKGLDTHHENISQDDVRLSRPKSERTISTKAKAAALAAAGLGAGEVMMQLSHDNEDREDVSEHEQHTPTRALSPIQSVASYKEDAVETLPHDRVRSIRSGASLSSAGREVNRKHSGLSIDSMSSIPSTKLARSRKRPQGVSLEKGREILGEDVSDAGDEVGTPRAADVDEWFERNHEENERYRSEFDEASQRDSSVLEYNRMSDLTDNSMDPSYLSKESTAKDIRDVGANPEYVHTPLAVESAVASLHDPSILSVQSSQSSHLKQKGVSPGPSFVERQAALAQQRSAEGKDLAAQRDSPSKERWGALRDHAQALSERSQQERIAANSPQQSVTRSVEDEAIPTGASALPFADDPMPEIGHGLDDESEINTNPSIIQGPIGGTARGDRAHWPYDPTPPLSNGNVLAGHSEQDDHDHHDLHTREAAALGTAAGVGLGVAGVHKDDASYQQPERSYQPSVEDEYGEGAQHGFDDAQDQFVDKNMTPLSQSHLKDEGYISAAQPGGITPEPYRKGSKLFDDDGLGQYGDDAGMDDPFASRKRLHHMSGMSHGMSSPLYDSATGKGIDRIQSKDVVALMDHLTVRDAQRNARDTEILVTLVRSAAEMRNSFEEMKKFIAEQDRMIINNTDRDAEMTVQKVLQGPRPQPLGSPRTPRRAPTEEAEDVPTRRKNVFRRALKGLSMKNSNDLSKIEDMLMQLLNDVDGLKEAQGLTRPSMTQTSPGSLTSYENLRAAPDPGYEPEGRAGTSSSPNHSGYLSNPSSRHVNGMHSGYGGRRGSEHRVSTVLEGDEEMDEYDADMQNSGYDNNERLLTPTQEARRSNSFPVETPPQQTAQLQPVRSNEQTPKTDKARKHKSNSSSIFGIPKLSRWSKTTSSTVPESARDTRNDRPYSEASRSGSNLDVTYYDNDYALHSDDRLRSATSLAAENAAVAGAAQPRSPSPLIPEERERERELDDPKYQAHRNSLNLQHPQPRPGPTHRHQTHLESQAHNFETESNSSYAPDTDFFGSNPSLALNRNRLSGAGGGAAVSSPLSPVYSDGAYSAHSAAEAAASSGPPRPPKVRDDGPLVPPKIPAATHQQHQQHQQAAPRPAGMYSSPFSSGHLVPLETIEEARYSLETERQSVRELTPSPRPRGGGAGGGLGMGGGGGMQSPARKITGPRPMGGRSASGREGGGGGGGGGGYGGKEGLLGTVRRKPVAARSQGSLESYRDSESETF